MLAGEWEKHSICKLIPFIIYCVWLYRNEVNVVLMQEDIMISIVKIVDSSLCVASGDGEKVYQHIALELKKGYGVAISFHDVEVLTPAFLSAAFSRFCQTFECGKIHPLIRIEDIQSDDQILLNRVVETVQQYLRNQRKPKRAARDALEKNGI